jgi:hypothetical protein
VAWHSRLSKGRRFRMDRKMFQPSKHRPVPQSPQAPLGHAEQSGSRLATALRVARTLWIHANPCREARGDRKRSQASRCEWPMFRCGLGGTSLRVSKAESGLAYLQGVQTLLFPSVEIHHNAVRSPDVLSFFPFVYLGSFLHLLFSPPPSLCPPSLGLSVSSALLGQRLISFIGITYNTH